MNVAIKIDEYGFPLAQYPYKEILGDSEHVELLLGLANNGEVYEKYPKSRLVFEEPKGLYGPKWNGVAWEESLTLEQIQQIIISKKQYTQEDYLLDLDFRLSMIELNMI